MLGSVFCFVAGISDPFLELLFDQRFDIEFLKSELFTVNFIGNSFPPFLGGMLFGRWALQKGDDMYKMLLEEENEE